MDFANVPSTVRIAHLARAERSEINVLAQRLRFGAHNAFSGDFASGRRLLHNKEDMKDVLAYAGADPAQQSARLELLFSRVVQKDYAFDELRQASATERRQVLGVFNEVFAVFEDIVEGDDGRRRHAVAEAILPRPEPPALRKRVQFLAKKPECPAPVPPCGPLYPGRGVQLANPQDPIPENHVRVLHGHNGRGNFYDVMVQLDSMTVNELISLLNLVGDTAIKRRRVCYRDGFSSEELDLSLRDAGVEIQTEMSVLFRLG